MDDTSISAEIHKLIDDRLNGGIVVHVEWVANAIIESRSDIVGSDAPWYREVAFKEIARLVKRALGKYDVDDTTPQTMLFPGFKHLCRAYSMERDERIVLVPVELCTVPELDARASQLEEQAKGCRSHAREIREYLMARTGVELAA